jgi:hypothetical protein
MPVTFQIKGVDRLVAALSSLPLQANSGVKVLGQTNYIKAMVWDLGYITREIKPGPKTMWSVNVYGEAKVLTITAPTGFIRVNRSRYLSILRAEYAKADFVHTSLDLWPRLIENMMANAAQQCAEIVAQGAPVDSGELRDSIVAALPDDDLFTYSGTGESDSWFE